MGKILHAEAHEMKKALDKHGIQELYHFTPIDNLSVIAKCRGLWSKRKLEQADLLDRVITGGNNFSLCLDKSLGNWDKIHLNLCSNTPMAYRVQQNPEGRTPQSSHICYFIIDYIVALWEGVYFTDTNATKDGHQRKQGLEGLRLIDFDTIKAHLNKQWVDPKQLWHRNIQAECLVPDEIPLKYVKAVSFISDASLKEGKRIWGNTAHPPFNVNEKLFHTGFPLVYDFLLTSKEVTKENIDLTKFEDTRKFIRERNSRVTLLVDLHAIAGTQAKVTWRDNTDNQVSEDREEFERENRYRNWPSLKIEDLEEGDYSVEYYLGEVRWFRVEFKIRR